MDDLRTNLLHGGDRVLTFPKQAAVGRIMPKEAFYKNLKLSNEIREHFVSDVKRIILEYKLAADTINIPRGEEVSEILVLSIEQKKPAIDYRIIENIARQNPHRILFIIKYQDMGQLVVYFKKLYKTDWRPLAEINLEAKGFDLDSVWEGFIEQIAFQNEEFGMINAELLIDERLKKQDDFLKIKKRVEKLERLSRNEIQPKKKFELYTQLQGLKKLLNKEGEEKWKS